MTRAVAIKIWMMTLCCCSSLLGEHVLTWDFTQGAHEWAGNPRVAPLSVSADGLEVTSTGHDPWITGPSFRFPTGKRMMVTIRMRSTADGSGEFFYGKQAQAGKSVRFAIQTDGKWHDYSAAIPVGEGPETRLRLDPCNDDGKLTIAMIRVEAQKPVPPPQWPTPRVADAAGREVVSVVSGDVRIAHGREKGAGFAVYLSGRQLAYGSTGEMVGVSIGEDIEWLRLADAEMSVVRDDDGALNVTLLLRDSRGGRLTLRRTFSAGSVPGTIAVACDVSVDAERDVLHIPWLTVFPGLGTFGERKHQGLFAGIEYLSDEPSSSEADVKGSGSIRRVPDPVKLTFPLMAIEHDGGYVGLVWDKAGPVAPVFDSPDRLFGSGSHVMALAGPPVGQCRAENDLVGHSPVRLSPGQILSVRAWIVGGKSPSVVGATRHYLRLTGGWPRVPEFEEGRPAALDLMARGWLDSAANEDGRFRHAVWQDKFHAAPNAEAAVMIDWLSIHVSTAGLTRRLVSLRDRTLEQIPAEQPFTSMISHARTPAAPFVFGRVERYIEAHREAAGRMLDAFDVDGVKHYRARGTDFGATHFADHANGYAARYVAGILEAAALCGDRNLCERGLALLDKQTTLYANTVPRGAQTWEVPLHTPDILASAYMIKAYVAGYLLSGREDFLDQAEYWAWTGVPFVYLEYPTVPTDVGLYATIAVLGATNWRAPYWIGQPVQWCGLVYADGLAALADVRPDGPWRDVARGIAATGLAMTWPPTDTRRQGLLPDYYLLRRQVREGPAINPGTVQALLPELHGSGSMYDVERVAHSGVLIHAPCRISNVDGEQLRFHLDGWGTSDYRVVAAGIDEPFASAEWRPEGITDWQEVPRKDVTQPASRRYAIVTLRGAGELRLK